jgi:hypothetical protein
MAKPRVFVSSTFYDLKQIRADLQAFITQMGYDPVLHERGSVPYGSQERLEEYCYREINLVEVLISIIGGRYGSASSVHDHSISQQEFKTAYDLERQVYIFVEAGVWAEYRTYLKNKSVAGFQSAHVDNLKVYAFLEEVEALPNNNPILAFETAADITRLLREQWAGLFQRFLREQTRLKETNLMKDMQSSVQTLNELIAFLTEERRHSSDAVQGILLANHPAFPALKKALKCSTPVFFRNRGEFQQWPKAYQYSELDQVQWDDAAHEEWIRSVGKKNYLLKIATHLFDESGKAKDLHSSGVGCIVDPKDRIG